MSCVLHAGARLWLVPCVIVRTMARARGAALHAFVVLVLLSLASLARAESPGDLLRAQLASADSGATINVPAGEYEGPFVLTKPVQLIGAPGAVLRGDKKTHVVAVRAPDVEIAGFTLRDSGLNLSDDIAAVHISSPRAWIHDNRIVDCLHGIYVRKADACRVERNIILGGGAPADVADPVRDGVRPVAGASGETCAAELSQDNRGNGIHLWNSRDHLIANNTISGTRDGVYFSFCDHTVVRDNTITRVRYGLHYMYSDENTFERNLFSENAAGAALMYSHGIVMRENRFVANRSHRAYGLLLQSVDNTRIENNEISGNSLGLFLENTNNLVVSGNSIAANYVGLRVADSSSGGRFFANSFSENPHPVETSGVNTANVWTDKGRGNHWDGVVRLDLDQNGISDLPHHEADLFGPWRREFPVIGLLSASPGERLLRFVHARLALPGVPGVTDPAPVLGQQMAEDGRQKTEDRNQITAARDPYKKNAANQTSDILPSVVCPPSSALRHP